ncbi:unnamed protein product [Schistosoma margrebowiei]|uniref:Uncharacterized protein n=1 Tax=Schistosoma margrebowiei TaxID=48269 RepID=A0A3P7Y863_9TREM|nr:unnamed protein product [Schistosoma margrebowiei]
MITVCIFSIVDQLIYHPNSSMENEFYFLSKLNVYT